jgi:hypothetical protein
MARTRNLKPGFFLNEDLADCGPLARLAFAGLWCHADKAGRLEDRPRRLKSVILPYDDCDFDDLLEKLEKSPGKFVVRYEVDGQKYIHIPKFVDHQNPHCKESDSIIPPPSGASPVQVPCKPCASPVQKQFKPGLPPSSSLPSSHHLPPSSLPPSKDERSDDEIKNKISENLDSEEFLESAKTIANRIAKEIFPDRKENSGPLTEDVRDTIYQAAVLSLFPIGAEWLDTAIEATKSKTNKQSTINYFRGCLQKEAEAVGFNFFRLRRAVRGPRK